MVTLKYLIISLLSTCSESHGKLTVFSMKAMLATMCGGKIVDKLRCKYIFDYHTYSVYQYVDMTELPI